MTAAFVNDMERSPVYPHIINLLLCLLWGYPSSVSCQNTFSGSTTYSDCSGARSVNLAIGTQTVSTRASGNSGDVQDLSPKKNPVICDDEHNSTWYRLPVLDCGILTFTITPDSSTNDVDFVLFNASAQNACANIQNNTLKPVRSNISRNDIQMTTTGLADGKFPYFVEKGPGIAFSKSLFVTKGQTYLLLVDNTRIEGKGHKVIFDLKSKREGLIYIRDHKNKPMSGCEGEIIGQTGNHFKKLVTDENGLIQLKDPAPVKGELQIYKQGYLPRYLDLENLTCDTTPLIVNLQLLSKYNTIEFRKPLFYANSYEIIPSAGLKLKKLSDVLKIDSSVSMKFFVSVIRDTSDKRKLGKFSPDQIANETRAALIKTMQTNGISQKRLSVELTFTSSENVAEPATKDNGYANYFRYLKCVLIKE